MVNSLHFYNVSHILHPVPFAFPGIPFPMVLTTMVITLTFDPRVILLLLKTWLAKYLAIQKLVDETVPEDFKAKYPSTRVIIDCTEIFCEMGTK